MVIATRKAALPSPFADNAQLGEKVSYARAQIIVFRSPCPPCLCGDTYPRAKNINFRSLCSPCLRGEYNYIPEWGQFASPDLLLDATEPEGACNYVFCGNDPVENTDSYGLYSRRQQKALRERAWRKVREEIENNAGHNWKIKQALLNVYDKMDESMDGNVYNLQSDRTIDGDTVYFMYSNILNEMERNALTRTRRIDEDMPPDTSALNNYRNAETVTRANVVLIPTAEFCADIPPDAIPPEIVIIPKVGPVIYFGVPAIGALHKPLLSLDDYAIKEMNRNRDDAIRIRRVLQERRERQKRYDPIYETYGIPR